MIKKFCRWSAVCALVLSFSWIHGAAAGEASTQELQDRLHQLGIHRPSPDYKRARTYANELASLSIQRFMRTNKESLVKIYAEWIFRAFDFEPRFLSGHYPAEVAGAEQRRDYFAQRQAEFVQEDAETIAADFVASLGGAKEFSAKELSEVKELAFRYVEASYVEEPSGRGRWLGAALLSLVRAYAGQDEYIQLRNVLDQLQDMSGSRTLLGIDQIAGSECVLPYRSGKKIKTLQIEQGDRLEDLVYRDLKKGSRLVSPVELEAERAYSWWAASRHRFEDKVCRLNFSTAAPGGGVIELVELLSRAKEVTVIRQKTGKKYRLNLLLDHDIPPSTLRSPLREDARDAIRAATVRGIMDQPEYKTWWTKHRFTEVIKLAQKGQEASPTDLAASSSASPNASSQPGRTWSADSMKALVTYHTKPGSGIHQAQAQIEEFLKRLGYVDYSKAIQETLDRKVEIDNEMARVTMLVNKERYDHFINLSREFASRFLALASSSPSFSFQTPANAEDQFMGRLVRYVGQLATIQPLGVQLQAPRELRTYPTISARVKALQDHVYTVRVREADQLVRVLVSNYFETLLGQEGAARLKSGQATPEESAAYASEAAYVSGRLATYIKAVYSDPQVNQTRWLGKAMILGLVKLARDHKAAPSSDVLALTRSSSTFRGLKHFLGKSGLHLENFVGRKVVITTKEGPQSGQLRTGDFVFERSYTQEAGPIAFGAIPHEKYEKRASTQGLSTARNIFSKLLVIEDDSLEEGSKWLVNLRHWLSQNAALAPGFSHIGQAVIFDDPDTGTATHWIFDNIDYLSGARQGEVRMNDVHQFAAPGETVNFGIGRMNGPKLAKYVASGENHRIVTRGGKLDTDFWSVYQVDQLDQAGRIVPKRSPPRATWKTAITDAEYQALRAQAKSAPAQFYREYERRLKDGWMDFIRRGTFFNWISEGARVTEGSKKYLPEKDRILGKSYLRGAYCSQTIYLVARIYAGVDLEPYQGKWRSINKWLKKAPPAISDQVMRMEVDNSKPDSRIIPPNSMAVQDFVEDVVKFYHSPKNVKEFDAQLTMDMAASFNPEWMSFTAPVASSALQREFGSLPKEEKLMLVHEGLHALIRHFAYDGVSVEALLGYKPSEATEIHEEDEREESGEQLPKMRPINGTGSERNS